MQACQTLKQSDSRTAELNTHHLYKNIKHDKKLSFKEGMCDILF